MNAAISPDLEAIQKTIEFKQELTAANPKSLMASTVLTKDTNAFMCPVGDLVLIPDFNPRIKDAGYFAHIRWLSDQIKEHGFLRSKPLEGYGGMLGKTPVIFVTDGHCRLEATKLAISEGCPIEELPLNLRDKSASMEDLVVGLVISNEGKKLSPLELAIVCKRLIGFGWAPQKIAQKISMTAEYVNQLLTVVGSPSAIREMVQQGKATVATALSAIRLHGDQASTVLDTALRTAQNLGKTKVTKKFMPEQVQKVSLTKTAPRMVQALERVKANDVYTSLPTDLQELINELLAAVALPAADSVAQTKSAKPSKGVKTQLALVA